MRRIILSAIVFLLLGHGGAFLHAQRGTAAPSQQGGLQVTLFSPIPEASPWGRTLNEIAAAWARVTNNQVRLAVRHGRTESETNMRLSLDSNTIQAAVFTSLGLSTIDPGILTVSAPFLIRNEAELNVVMDEIQGDLERRLNNGNFTIVAWSKSGFVNVFSREPVFIPEDLKRMRLGSSIETASMNVVFRSMGFQVTEAEWGEIGRRLLQNPPQIHAVYNNPAFIAATQLHTPDQGSLRNMLTTNIAPVLGGIVINQQTWQRIGALNPRYQQELIRVTREIAARLDRDMQRTVNDAVQTMSRDGLTVNRPTQAQEQLWYDELARAMPSLMGSALDMDLYQRIDSILSRYRGSR